jgi:hypothetical protein
VYKVKIDKKIKPVYVKPDDNFYWIYPNKRTVITPYVQKKADHIAVQNAILQEKDKKQKLLQNLSGEESTGSESDAVLLSNVKG